MSHPLGYAGLGCFALGLMCSLVAIGVPDWLNIEVGDKPLPSDNNPDSPKTEGFSIGLWKTCTGEDFYCYRETLRALMLTGFTLAVGATVLAGIQISVKNGKNLAYIAGGIGALAGMFFLAGVIFFSDKKDTFAMKLHMSSRTSKPGIPEVNYGAAFIMAIFAFLLTVAGSVITPYRVYKYPLENQPTTKTTTREL